MSFGKNNYTTETAQIKRDILNFSKNIFEGMCKPEQKLCQDMIYGINVRKSVLLSDIARGLKEKTKIIYTVDRLSSHLNNMDSEYEKEFENNYLKEALKYIDNEDEYVIVLNDDTDINHEQAKKMEDLCLVRDASSKQEKYVNGYKVCEYAALSKNMKSPISLYSKVYSTESKEFISENNETIIGEEVVIDTLKTINKKPIFVRDRGYDANEFFKRDIEKEIKFITRLKQNRNLIFKKKNENDDDEENEKVLMFLTNLDVEDKNDAIRVVYTYFMRWRIEEYFKAKKSYNWESSLIRSLKGINNLNMFLTMVMLYTNEYIEKLETNFLSNIIIERALQIKERCIVYFGQMREGIYEILKFAKNGIRNFQNINHKKNINN